MDKSILFAVDPNTEETIVSSSQKGSNQVDFIERIGRQENEVLYNAVATLTSISRSSNFDVKIFKAMDKVCQMIYSQYKES
jgi:uncharacterized protein (UPF0335 family)